MQDLLQRQWQAQALEVFVWTSLSWSLDAFISQLYYSLYHKKVSSFRPSLQIKK